MSPKPLDTIEFVGGPFDGHVEQLSIPAHALPHRLVCFVSENVFRMFNGQQRVDEACFTSVAIYKRQLRSGNWVYFFCRAVRPSDQVQQSHYGGFPSDDLPEGEP